MGMFYDQLLRRNYLDSFIYCILTGAFLHTSKEKRKSKQTG